jgi:uncharacterized repeat protein (TIGR02543 family)
MKKHGLLFGIALVCIMLFSICDNAADTPEIQTPVKNGYGRISISFAGEESDSQTARTVFPSTALTHYVYTFTKAGETAGTVKAPDTDGSFTLEVGSYTVEVQACVGAAEPYTLAARGVSAQFNVGPGNNAPVEVRLSGVAAEGQGKFSYTITYPVNAEAAISLQKWPELGSIALNPIDVAQGNGKTQTLELDAGSYLLTVLVSKNGLYAGLIEAVHVYSTVVTEYTENFVDGDLVAEKPPTVNDYTIGGTSIFTYDGAERTAIITRKESASTGAVTILYNGEETPPVNAGTCTVTFNVAAAPGWNAANGLPAGTITINKAAGAAVGVPTLNGIATHNIIAVNAVTAPGTGQTVEYAINTSDTAPAAGWQADTAFTNLDAGTTYYIFARSKENTNYTTGAASAGLSVTPLQTVSPDRFEYYWIDRHGSLVTTSGGMTVVYIGQTLIITAQGTGYVVEQWHLDGVNTGQSGNTYNFSSTIPGKHTVGLFVKKDGKLYNTNIVITVTSPITVTFNINSGTGTVPASQTIPAGSGITLPGGSGFSRNGYTFSGWNTDASGTGMNYNAGFFYTPTGDITFYARWNTGNGSEAYPFPLTAGVWEDGSITSSGSVVWYSFDVINGTTYRIWWNDRYQGNSTKTSDIKVDAAYSNGTAIFTGVDSAYDSARSFTANQTGTVKLMVYLYSSEYIGTFAVVYSIGNTSTRP